MDTTNAHKYLPLVEALRDGELQEQGLDGKWYDCHRCALSMEPERYRRKPEPRELWVNIHKTGGMYAHETRDSALINKGGGLAETIRVREVID
jgi:hypothetical protein